MKCYPWQQTQWNRWQQRRKSGLPHGILFSGPEGTGKQGFATAYAHSLLCEHPQQGGQACGQCTSCKLLAADTHPDLKLVAPEEEGKSVLVDQIRELIHYLSLTPHTSQRKVALIFCADTMNVAASNSLLKSLEEPPPASLLILVSSRPASLLPTIRSRCQIQTFPMPDTDIARIWLSSRIEDQEQSARFLALAAGAPLKALEFAEEDSLELRENLLKDLIAINERKAFPIDVAGQWLKQDLQTSLYWIGSLLKDMVRLAVSPAPPVLANPDLQSKLISLGQRFELYQLCQMQQQLDDTERYVKGNMNPQLLLEELLITWGRLQKAEFRGLSQDAN